MHSVPLTSGSAGAACNPLYNQTDGVKKGLGADEVESKQPQASAR